MPFRLIEQDIATLKFIAEHRILTISQIAAMFHRNKQVVRRRMQKFEKRKLVEVVGSQFGRGRGRPENSLGLTKQGVDVLKDKGLLGKDVSYDNVVADSFCGANHQILLNWFRIHLKEVEDVLLRVNIPFFAHNSPYLPKDQNGHILISDCSPVPGVDMQGVKFTPDAVFSIRDLAAEKTCLFFLEVDRGTETMASPKRDLSDIRQKIVNYQWYFQSKGYKRYEEVFNCELCGFRLLFFTSTYGRLAALCKLTQEIFPTNFVWLTECVRLFTNGASAKIWARGGDLRAPQLSILGSLCCKAPLP